jgi:hypothetical protein
MTSCSCITGFKLLATISLTSLNDSLFKTSFQYCELTVFTTDPMLLVLWKLRQDESLERGKVDPMLINKQHAMKMYGGVEV